MENYTLVYYLKEKMIIEINFIVVVINLDIFKDKRVLETKIGIINSDAAENKVSNPFYENLKEV